MPTDDERPKSGLVAFWTSLPGVLTGVAALVAAVAGVAALFVGGDGNGPEQAAVSAGSPTVTAPSGDGEGCPDAYFEGIPEDRLDPVEAGTADFDAITANQPKTGPFGLALTNNGAAIGAIRLNYFPDNALFKIESIVDERCAQIDDYENISRGGDPNVLQNWDTVRMQLGGKFYDLRIGESTTIRLNFVAYAP
jgi:hypothetical protein